LQNISQNEFVVANPDLSVLAVRTSNKTIDLLSTESLEKVGVIEAE